MQCEEQRSITGDIFCQPGSFKNLVQIPQYCFKGSFFKFNFSLKLNMVNYYLFIILCTPSTKRFIF